MSISPTTNDAPSTKHDVLGVGVDAVDYEAAVGGVIDAARQGRPLSVSALAVHGVMTGVMDREHRWRLNGFDMICPDGQPVRWALNWLHGAGLTDRVYGPNLMLQVCERAAATGVPIFLFGGSEELLATLSDRLTARFPELQIAGVRASKFRTLSDEERDELVQEIRDSGARLAFVGLGCPRQEVFAYEMRDRLSMPLLAVGAAFNFHAGQLDQAPDWMQRRGLEWAYRLGKEPRRLWRRYLLLNPLFASLLLAQMVGLKLVRPCGSRAPAREICYG
ncbi:putative N-acetylmannosaminyltransferase [Pseudobythopirellula maris]|uniref:Putative N-acetylmannosaminyltransferase n=1 Tax=Pseudobythopirellula maris TaxID=2527991 RepID=A0A5C5ZT86_9BACT|nr:WecB/TagA/CpsF family glycosyltransferase [Pseudobythopirellula maris]TWT90238.1 putative N-acetylmannosaminyltransferase [Pseudobythopirellula maris]